MCVGKKLAQCGQTPRAAWLKAPETVTKSMSLSMATSCQAIGKN